MANSLKRILLGTPLSTIEARHERLAKIPALAIFASDNMSSVAYATEEILLVLVLGGAVAMRHAPQVGIAIGLLAAIVATSYWQTIHAYPTGGGAYIVAKDNLGTLPGLVAGGALLVDYVLTVSVSTASGVAAITSAFPSLYPDRVWFCVTTVILIMVANLRGIRETGKIFAVPTYWFIACLAILLGGGLHHLLTHGAPPAPPEALVAQEPVTIFLMLRAFSGGCAALTGTEALANGVQYFKPPEARNAGITLIWMAGILATSFLGVTFLAHWYHIVPRAEETVVSMLVREIFGRGWVYYMIQAATATILLLAANTSFAGFPMLASLMAKDGFLPRQLANRGDRLVYSNGILILAGISCLLLVIFGGSTHALIPLYAIGVFVAFTLSQTGMVLHWRRERSGAPGPR
jgi:amino acid transporter